MKPALKKIARASGRSPSGTSSPMKQASKKIAPISGRASFGKSFEAAAGRMWPSLIAVLLALFLCGILLALTGHNPLRAYATLLNGAFGNKNRFAETLVKTVPILILALGTSVAFRGKLWNIGGNGQYTAGAVAAVAVAVYVPLPIALRIPLSLLASLSAGILIGGGLGLLRAKLNANEVITTLMVNYIMVQLLSWLVNGPMMDPEGFGFPQTPLVPEAMKLPILLAGTRLHFGLIPALLTAAAAFVFWRTRAGFRIDLVGENPEVAAASGVKVSKNIVAAMALSAAVAAFAGWVDAFGLHGRLQENLSGDLGTIAVVVALLGGLNPVGITAASFFFSVLVVGGATMQRFEGVPYSLVGIIQGLIIVFIISRVVFDRFKEARRVRNLVR